MKEAIYPPCEERPSAAALKTVQRRTRVEFMMREKEAATWRSLYRRPLVIPDTNGWMTDRKECSAAELQQALVC